MVNVMTPKEKALSLCQSFGWITVGEDANEGLSLPLEVAKKCAVIAVDELIKLEFDFDNYYPQHKYWQQVKKEIELL